MTKGEGMRKFVVCAVILSAVVGAGIAYSAASPSAKLVKQDRVWGGGIAAASASDANAVCAVNGPNICINRPRNFAVDGHAEGDGSQATGNSGYATQTGRTVTCVNVDGTKAAIGGVITATSNGAGIGDVYVQYFQDRGTTAPASQRDYMSLVYAAPLDDAFWEGALPAGFPYVCPAAGGTSGLPAFYFELDGGDITVQDAPAS
jgi:hypothetical protein